MKRRMEVRLAIVVALIAVMSLVLFPKERAYAQTPPEPLFQANIGGTTIDLDAGTVSVRGQRATLPSDGGIAGASGVSSDVWCELPSIQLSGAFSENYSESSVEISVTEQCELKVVNITSIPSLERSNQVATGASGASEGRLVRGWAKSELNDPDEFGIDLAWTRAEIKFTLHRDSTVEYPHDRFYNCGRFALTGWRVRSCRGVYGSSGPYIVWNKAVGRFDNVLICPVVFGKSCEHTQSSRYASTAGHSCTISPSRVVFGTHFRCRGGWEYVR